MLLLRKLFEMFGENFPQLIMQVAIKLHDYNLTTTELNITDTGSFNEIKPLWKIILFNPTIMTSLVGLLIKASTIYLELVSKDAYGVKMIPFSSIKLKVIVIPLMMFAVIPRVSSLAVFLGSSFPLFDYGSEDREKFIFGVRFGLIPLMSILSIYMLLSLVYWCFHVKKQKKNE